MAPSPERQDEHPPDPADAPMDAAGPEPTSAPAARPAPERRLRLTVTVPELVWQVCQRNEKDPAELAHAALRALWRKLTPERGPADKGPYAGEICYFQRLLDSPSEVLTMGEEFFVLLDRLHEGLRELSQTEGSDFVRGEVLQAVVDIAEWVTNAQKIVRLERGEDAPQIDWKVTEP